MRLQDHETSVDGQTAAWMRDHPFAVAGVASAGGLVGGALLVVLLFGSSWHRDEASSAANAIKSHATNAVQTTGAASRADAKTEPAPSSGSAGSKVEAASPAGSETATVADCQEQTWPYIARSCLAGQTPARAGVRVISTDKLSDPAIAVVETPPAEVTNRMVRTDAPRQPLPPPPAMIAAPEPAPVLDERAVAISAPEVTAAPANVALAPETSPPAKIEPAFAKAPQASSQQPLAAAESRRAAPSKPVRQQKTKRTRPSEDMASSGDDSRPRIVERWTEREYNVQSDDGSSQGRRVIVIRRSGDGRSGDEDFVRPRQGFGFARSSFWD